MRAAGAVRLVELGIFVLVAPLLDRLELAAADIAGDLAAENEFVVGRGGFGGGVDG